MSRVKQSRLNSRRARTRLRATPEGRALHRAMVAKGRGPLSYFEPGALRVARRRHRHELSGNDVSNNAVLAALTGLFRRKTG